MPTINIPVNEEIQKRLTKYERCRVLAEDDESAFLGDTNHKYIFKLAHESAAAYEIRKQVFINGLVNPSIELLTAPGNTIFRKAPKEEIEADDNSLLFNFAQNVNLSKSNPTPLLRWMQEEACTQLRQYGTVFVVFDQFPVNALSKEQRLQERIWPYITKLLPDQVLNWYFGIDGQLEWFAYKTCVPEAWTDPTVMPKKDEQIRILFRDKMVIKHSGQDVPDEIKPHNFGFVPVVWQSAYTTNSNQIIGDCSFFTSAKLIISAGNYIGCSNVELLKNSSPTLVMSTDSIDGMNSTTDKDGNVKLKKIDDSNVLTYAGEKVPAYLVRSLELIPLGNAQYQLYMAEAIENEKNAKSVRKKGVDGADVQQSGIQTAFEQDPIKANIASTAIDCEILHRKILSMASLILKDVEQVEWKVEYEREYDIKSFEQKLNNLKTFVADISGYPSETGKRTMYKSITSQITDDPKLAKTINQEIDEADMSEEIIKKEDIDKLMNPENMDPNKAKQGE